MAGHTRTQLREEVALALDSLFERTATGGSTSTVVDATLVRFADDFWNGAEVFIKTDAGGAGGAPQGESSYCTDFASSTGTLTCSPLYTAAPASGDTYQIYRLVSKADIDRALNKVCYGAHDVASLTPSATTLDYALSSVSALRHPGQMVGVYRRDINRTDSMPYEVRGWQIADDSGSLTLRLPYLCNADDGLWIVYVMGEDGMCAESSTVNLPVALVRARACVYLIENLIAGENDTGMQRYGMLLRRWTEEREKEERKLQRFATRARRHRWELDQETYSGPEIALGLLPNFGGDFSSYP